MSLHNFNPNNKSWKMYSNTITSISGDNLTIRPYDGKNLLLEVSGNNNIFFKKGDISYGLDDLIDGGNSNITLTNVSGDIIPSNDNTFKLGDVSKNWSNAYIRDLSVSNISVSGNIFIPSNSINSSHIINGSILTEDICNNTITRNKLSELTTNLMIFNYDTSTTTLEYNITLNTAGTITTYFVYPLNGIGIGMTHSLRVCVPSITTQIAVQIDPDDKTVNYNEIYNGAIQVGTFTNNTLTFTLDPAGYDNIQIGFVIVEDVSPPPPPANTGFWGNFTVLNQTAVTHRYMDVYLAYNDVPLTSTERIHGDISYTFNIPEENRLPLVSSILQLKLTMQENTESVDLDAYDGFSIESFTSNPLDEENTLDMLVNANNYNDGVCSATFIVSYDPGPPVAPSMTYTGSITEEFPWILYYNGGIMVHSTIVQALPFTITFPAGTTRVEIRSPATNFVVSTVDFVPTANQTSANVSVNKINGGYYDTEFYIQLKLNNELGYSSQYFLGFYQE